MANALHKTKCYTAFLMASSALMPASPTAPKASGGAFSGGESKAAKMARYAAFVAAADTEKGLSAAAIPALRTEFGFNELMDNRRHPVLVFLLFFWGPMPCMIWAAIIIELAQGILTGDAWLDFAVLCFLQVANAVVGFVEEYSAGNAIEALKSRLAPVCNVYRDGVHARLPGRELVPGDLIEVKLGDVVPADAVLLPGRPVQVDQAALTGESLPVTAAPGALLMMSSAIKMGHARALVVATGRHTFIGSAAKLMSETKHTSNLTRILLGTTMTLLVLCIVACACIFARLYVWDNAANAINPMPGANLGVQTLGSVVVILVASIPVAIEVVVTSTMAVGSHIMAEKKVIVARLSAIEELAGMTVLCSDKTGTLTLNKLSLREPVLLHSPDADDLLFHAAAASQRGGELDAIDACIVKNLAPARAAQLAATVELDHAPFDPIAKRTLSICQRADGSRFKVSKGAPQVILRMAWNSAQIAAHVGAVVDELAARGFRSLGVAASEGDGEERWEYLGVLSLFDPPRPDSAATIREAIENGVEVKMVTGDHGKIARETCRELGMGTNILNTEELDAGEADAAAVDKVIMEAHGFAEVMPEHKFLIVKRIQGMGHITGMTGDGVNDAPALKRADIGIAVHGATDAARAAAAIVLTEEGIAVIITAMFESRKIFQRMRNYITYRIACTMQLLFFFFFTILIMQTDSPYFYGDAASPNWPAAAGSPYAPGLPALPAGTVSNATYAYAPASFVGCTQAPASLAAGVWTGCSYANPGYPLPWQNGPGGGSGGAGGLSYSNGGGTAYATSHQSFFTLPIFSLVIITILNDGCMITISGDFVRPEKVPQVWDMWKVWLIATVLGAVACLSSLVLVACAMNANYLHPGQPLGVIWGSFSRDGLATYQNFLTFFEVQSIMYLKVSVSDFLTLFSARTRGPFWERPLSRPLFVSFLFATASSTLLSLFWCDIFARQPANYMACLRYSPGAVIATWTYSLIWWMLQDAAKVGTYWLMDTFLMTGEERARSAHAASRTPGALPRVDSSSALAGLGKQALAETAILAHHDAERKAAAVAAGGLPSPAPQLYVVAALSDAASSAAALLTGGLVGGKADTLGRRTVPAANTIPDGTDLNAALRGAQRSITARSTLSKGSLGGGGGGGALRAHVATIFPPGASAKDVTGVQP